MKTIFFLARERLKEIFLSFTLSLTGQRRIKKKERKIASNHYLQTNNKQMRHKTDNKEKSPTER
jgi:hypothetical protein